MGVFSNIIRAGNKIYEGGKSIPSKPMTDETMPPRQQRRVDVTTQPTVVAPANRDARLIGGTMGGMAGQAVGALKGRRQRIEDAINNATGYKRGGLVKYKKGGLVKCKK